MNLCAPISFAALSSIADDSAVCPLTGKGIMATTLSKSVKTSSTKHVIGGLLCLSHRYGPIAYLVPLSRYAEPPILQPALELRGSLPDFTRHLRRVCRRWITSDLVTPHITTKNPTLLAAETEALCLLIAPVLAQTSDPDLRLNQIQVVGTHKSYQMPADPRVMQLMVPR